jgi:hypothetical protein
MTWALLAAGVIVSLSAAYLFAAIIKSHKQGDLRADIRESLKKSSGAVSVLTVAEFGAIERSIAGLTEVIIVAHMVENPEENLRQAVITNFKKGIRYRFCVSRSNYKTARELYEGYFHALFDVAKAELRASARSGSSELDLAFDDVFIATPLRKEWLSWPYVFYVQVDDSGQESISAFRGDQLREGIAENYVQLSAADARSVFNAVDMAVENDEGLIAQLMADAEFSDATNVIQISARR